MKSDTRETVKAAVMTGPRHIKEAMRPINSPGYGEVELQVGFVGLCGTDIHAFNGYAPVFDFPVVFGHEFSARVLRYGPGVEHLAEGQWVSVAPLLSCGDCSFCRTGNNQLCEQRIIFGAKVDGALRERVVLPAEVVFPLPADVPPPDGALGEPLAVAIHAVNQAARDVEGARIIISGAGAIGLLVAMVVQQRGAGQILVLDIDEKRRSFGWDMGFEVTHPEEAQPASADLLFICSGAPETITTIPEILAPLGTAVIVGVISEAELNWFDLMLKQGTVTTSRYFILSDYREGIQLLGREDFKAKKLIEGQVDFEELFIDEGQKVMERAQQVVRLLVKM